MVLQMIVEKNALIQKIIHKICYKLNDTTNYKLNDTTN